MVKWVSKLFMSKGKRLHEDSKSIMNVFTKTQTDLEKVNDKISTHNYKLKAKIAELKLDSEDLEKRQKQNASVAQKISEFIN